MKTLFGIFCIVIILINTLGYSILNSHMKKQTAILQAGQNQIAGFLMVPNENKTGPIRVLNKKKSIPHKIPNPKLKEKDIK